MCCSWKVIMENIWYIFNLGLVDVVIFDTTALDFVVVVVVVVVLVAVVIVVAVVVVVVVDVISVVDLKWCSNLCLTKGILITDCFHKEKGQIKFQSLTKEAFIETTPESERHFSIKILFRCLIRNVTRDRCSDNFTSILHQLRNL